MFICMCGCGCRRLSPSYFRSFRLLHQPSSGDWSNRLGGNPALANQLHFLRDRTKEVCCGGEKVLGERARERDFFFLPSRSDFRLVSTTPCRVTPPLGARAPAYDGECYTSTLRLAMWHALADTRGLRPSSVRPNHLAFSLSLSLARALSLVCWNV